MISTLLRTLFTLSILFAGNILIGQEICDNGIDDDGDGMVDLYDTDCECNGILIEGPSALIPNPSFEDMNCCPTTFSEFSCASQWSPGNSATTDYLHTCGFVLPAVNALGLVPFPGGSGIAGMVFSDGWKEYIMTCLNEPMEAGAEFILTFQVAAVTMDNFGNLCNNGVPTFGAIEFTLFGHASCNGPVGGSGCPSNVDPNWIELGTVVVAPVSSWVEVSITFTPPVEISAIMMGPPCIMPPGFSGNPCFAYYLVDELDLTGEILYDELDLFATGLPCNFNYTLDAFIDHQGGNWQWYFNGAAIPGQTSSTLPVSENNYQSGMYQVRYITDDGCVTDSISVTIPFRDTIEVEVFFCPETSVSCSGETYFEPGTYNVNLITPEGCDSVVTCIVTEYVLVPTTVLEIDTCGPVEINVCNEIVSDIGYYEFLCYDYRGCDSIVTLDLRVMTPQAIITPPSLLDCSPNADVVLDGSLSPLNPLPSGTITYEWTGPVDGFNSGLDEPWAIVNKPGTYCLVITFENNGIACTDTACVTVMSSSALPATPLLTGPNGGCPDDLLTFTLSSQGDVQPTGYEWFLPSGLQLNLLNDSTLTYYLEDAGTVTLCGRTFNECGASDTVCIDVITAFTDTFFLQGTTCDPGQAGVFESSHINQFGCDSIVVNTITLSPSHSNTLVSTTCDPALAGVDTMILSNQYGCDSIEITQVNLLPSNQLNLIAYTCDSLAAGLDTLFLLNQHGCDSIVYIDRIFAGRFQEETYVQICGAGQPYADSLTVTGGACDSLFITHFSFIPLDTTLLNASTCDPSQVGITVNIVPAFSGCDSTIITQTTLLPSDATAVQAFTCDIAQAGQEVFNLQNQYGCDSIVTLTTQYVGVDTQFVQLTTCEIQEAGTEVLVLPGTYCDTIRVVVTSYIPGSQSTQTVMVCADGGPIADTLFLTNFEGCDSLAIREFQYIFLEAEVEVVNERCQGQRDGEITVTTVTGGEPPLEYRLELSLWQPSPVFGSLTPGNYTVYVRDSRGCEDTLSGIVVAQGVNLVIEAGPDQLVDYGSLVPLNVTSSHPLDQVTWSAIDAIPCVTCPTTTVGPVYVEQVVNVIGVTADGCEAEDFLNLRVRIVIDVYIPNSFSPDNNGINDIFSIYGNQFVSSVRNLNIYDRWGNALYARADLPINDPSAGWDGTFRGEPMDPGVYIYVVEVELTDGTVRLYKGDVTVVK